MWDGSQAWLVTRYEDVRFALSDPRFSSDVTRPGFPTFYPAQRVVVEEAASFIRTDPPEHSRLRRMLTRDFMAKQIEPLRPRVQQIVDALIDDLLLKPPPADLVESLTLAVPSQTVCVLLGISYADHQVFQELTKVNLSRSSSAEQTQAATADLMTWVEDVVSAQEREPGEGLIGRLVVNQVRTGQLSHEDLVSMVRLILVAGHETTANMLGLTVLSFTREPERYTPLVGDRAALNAAVEELLRYHSIVQIGLARVTTDDVLLGDTQLRAQEGVVVSLLSANRDERAYDEPDELDLARRQAKHVAFGFGPHQCIGQSLARMEVQVVLETVARRLPSLRSALPLDELAFRHEMTVHGLHEFPATWEVSR
jgi:cytochrome P450